MSTRSGRTIAKVTRFDPTDKKSNNDVKKPKKSSKKKSAAKVAKAGKTAVSKKAKGAKRKASKLNADGTPKEKRPKTAYFLFMDEERPNVKKAYPNFDIKEVASELGKRWKALPDAKKAVRCTIIRE